MVRLFRIPFTVLRSTTLTIGPPLFQTVLNLAQSSSTRIRNTIQQPQKFTVQTLRRLFRRRMLSLCPSPLSRLSRYGDGWCKRKTCQILDTTKGWETNPLSWHSTNCRICNSFMLSALQFPSMVRNVAIVGHLHHGKTSLMDMLIHETHVLPWDSDKQVSHLGAVAFIWMFRLILTYLIATLHRYPSPCHLS